MVKVDFMTVYIKLFKTIEKLIQYYNITNNHKNPFYSYTISTIIKHISPFPPRILNTEKNTN